MHKHNINNNFWKWFADSKILDDNGNPLVCYHGTPATFDTFDIGMATMQGRKARQGVGFYFTNIKDAAKGYGRTLECYLKMEKPFYTGDKYHNITKQQFKQICLKGDYDWFWTNWLPHQTDLPADTDRETLLNTYVDLVEKWSQTYGDTEYFQNLGRAFHWKSQDKCVKAISEVLDCDGIIYEEKPGLIVYVVFNPNQIKSIDNNGKWSDSINIYEQNVNNYKQVLKQLNEILAYAGSGIDYDKPSYKAIGLGEGHAAHGWGFYYAVDPDVADSYRLEAINGDTLYFFGKTYVVMDIRGFNDRFIDHGDIGLDIVLQYCYNQIRREKELDVNEIIDILQRKIKYLKWELDNKLSDDIETAKREIVHIEQEIKDFIPDKKLKELQQELAMWKSEDITKILDNNTIERRIKELQKQIETEKINIENENELNLLRNLKAKWSNRLGDLQDNVQFKDIKNIEEMLEFLNKNKNKFNKQNIFMISDNEGVVKKVELPDGPYIEEAESLQNQDRKVKNAFYKLCLKFGLDDGEMVNVLGDTGKSAYDGLCSLLQEKYGYHYKLRGTGKRADKIISRLLNQQGIKGIHYFGEQDGECYVIFNQLDIKML